MRPGPGREAIVFHTFEQDGRLRYCPPTPRPWSPKDVWTGSCRCHLPDRQGYDDGSPLIVGSSGTTSTRTTDRLIALSEQGSPVTPRVWLDGQVYAVLDRSTAQIGAPTVWQVGARGEGGKVAVLDTGAIHLDLAGRVSQAVDFSGSGSTNDTFGHGTHVAPIVGGSGAASGGSRKSVAPGAELLVGKLLGDDGNGSESAVIASMEWAAGQGAKVVSMSLSSNSPSDGQDAMSQAVDQLSGATSHNVRDRRRQQRP